MLAIVDSDDPALLDLLDADVTLTLSPTEDPAKVQVTVAERDFGTIGSAYLQPDLHPRPLPRRRSSPLGRTDSPAAPALSRPPVERQALELAEAALPYTSGGRNRGLPAALTHELAACGPPSPAATRRP